MSVAVIGAGLWGAAAARHLAKAGVETILIGPGEPEDLASHDGPFGSHYDEGRITRRNDSDPFWAKASSAAIDRYGEIEAESGIAFHTPCGGLMMGPDGDPFEQSVGHTAAKLGVTSERLDPEALRTRFPYVTMPDGTVGHYELDGAGHISPRRLTLAQIKAAKLHGARHLPVAAKGLREGPNWVEIDTDHGTVFADQVIVAAGAWTDQVLGRSPQLTIRPRTIVLFELPDADVASLANMPHLIFYDRPDAGIYILPPIRYPDGRTYLKIGGDPFIDPLDTPKAVRDWFRSDGNAKATTYLTDVTLRTLPGLTPLSQHSKACVTTYTPEGYPDIARLSDRITVCAAGCGKGAKNSDEFGRRAALIAMDAQAAAA